MVVKGRLPGQRLLLIFITTIFIPGLLLAIFGVRALRQEKRSTDQQVRTRLDDAVNVTTHVLADQLEQLDKLVNSGLPPETAFQSFPPDGSWAFVESHAGNLRVYPPRVLPYELTVSPIVPADPGLADVAKVELSGADPARVIAAYQELISKAKPSLVPEIKHRLAQTLLKTGKTKEAELLWRDVQAAGGAIGALPADFVAASQIASLDAEAALMFCSNLTNGHWRIERVRYEYYLADVCAPLGVRIDNARLQLADAVDAISRSSFRLLQSGNETYLTFRQEKPFRALVVSREFLVALLLPRLTAAAGTDMEILRITVNDKQLYGKSGSPANMVLPATRGLDRPEVSWRIDVAPKDAAGIQAAMARTTNVYFIILVGVILVLAFGGYFIARTIRRELEVARMKSDFVSTVSHEFRSPLTGIRQLGEMLSRGRVTDPDKRQQYYDLIVRESDRLTRLVENVLDFSRMEDGRKQYFFEVLDTSAWLHSLAEEFRPQGLRSGHQLEADIPVGLPLVRGDREALTSALRNLLDNACKYSPQSTTVWLNAVAVNGGVRVQVRDRGVGIPAREQSQIFEKFYRGNGELEKQVKGAGLGLSLVRHIVASHHGEIRVESREGEGSTFSIHLAGAA